MSLLYRAIWSDASSDNSAATLALAKEKIAGWLYGDTQSTLLTESAGPFTTPSGADRTYLFKESGSDAFEVDVSDIAKDKSEWSTRIRVIRADGILHFLVENGMESEDLAKRVEVGRPRIVHDLLQLSQKPHLDGSGILTKSLEIPQNGVGILTDLLANPSRTLPTIVCTEAPHDHKGHWRHRAEQIAKRTEGVATVVTLTRNAVNIFKHRLGKIATWDGSIRIYAPGSVDSNSDGWKHRYYLNSKIEADTKKTIDRIVYSATQLSTRRRIPRIFNVLDSIDDQETANVNDESLSTLDFELELAREELGDLERELAKSNGHLSRIKEALLRRGLGEVIWGTQQETSTSIPDEVQDTSEAVTAAVLYLNNWVTIPDSAVRELEAIDTTPSSFAWGNTTWRGLRALAAYAEDRHNGWNKGGFWEWCSSGSPLGWPATTKKLSMSESETVQNTDKLAKKRVFDIDQKVSPSGSITMLAHLKIAEGGGDLAPRVYFYDDTGGPTKKIHVGLIGPHYLVPNKSTN